VRSKGCLSNKTALAMIFKLAEAAEKNWRRLDGHSQLPKVVLGVKFATVSRSSERKLKPLPPDPFRHQDSAIARSPGTPGAFSCRSQFAWAAGAGRESPENPRSTVDPVQSVSVVMNNFVHLDNYHRQRVPQPL
jgi:hypothetical protein